MSDDPAPRLRTLKVLAAAAESRDWPWAVAVIRGDLVYRVTPEELTAHPAIVLELTWALYHGPQSFVVEMQAVMWDGIDPGFLQADTCQVPSLIAEQCFNAALPRGTRAAAAGEWATVCTYASLLLELPGASSQREERLLDLFAGLVTRARQAETTLLAANDRWPRALRASETAPFKALVAILVLAAQSAAYDALTGLLLNDLLRGAAWPRLTPFDRGTIVLLWPELSALHASPRRHALGVTAQEWLDRVMVLNGTDEEFAAGERDET